MAKVSAKKTSAKKTSPAKASVKKAGTAKASTAKASTAKASAAKASAAKGSATTASTAKASAAKSTTTSSLHVADVPAAFAGELGTKANAVYRAIFRELANPRAGTAKTKKRDEVSGGGRKPWRQKGTGRARQGSIRSPQWAHGGVVFGPQPRSYVSRLNKKERRAALVAALSDKFQHGAVSMLDAADLGEPKTKAFATLLFGSPKAAKTGDRTLVVYASTELASVGPVLDRGLRNLERVTVTHTGALDVKDVVGYARLVLTTAAHDDLVAAHGKETK
jgi:large subunit ribosomal protein L4